MTIKKLKASLPERCYLSDLWKPENEKHLRLSVYDYGNLGGRSQYRFHLEMNYSGKVIAVEDEYHLGREDISETCQKLVGKQIDLESFEWYYEKEVKDSPASMIGKQNVLGIVRNGRFVPFTLRNAHQLNDMVQKTFASEHLGNGKRRMREYGNYSLAEWFQRFLRKNRANMKGFSIIHEHGTDYRYEFRLGAKKIELTLRQFFQYSLTAVITAKSSRIALENEKVLKVLSA